MISFRLPFVLKRPNKDQRDKRKRLKKWRKKHPKFFLYTSKTKETSIPRKTLTHLRVDSSVTVIPERTFHWCTALVQVQLPDTLTRIERFAFSCCSNLRCVQFVSPDYSVVETSCFNQNLEDGVLLFPKRVVLQVDDCAFSFCDGLRKVVVCSISTKLGKVRNCSGLLSIELPEGLQVIETSSFGTLISLTMVKIPSSVIKIGSYNFFACRSLRSVDLPHGLLEIEDNNFWRCDSIETLHIPATVSSIGKSTFASCIGLKHIKLPPTLERIEENFCSGCERLEFVEIPKTVKRIDRDAFSYCSSLSHVRIPSSVESMGCGAFSGCSSMISIELPEGLLLEMDPEGSRSLVNVAGAFLIGSIDFVEQFLQYSKFGSVVDSVVDGVADLHRKLKHRFDSSPLNELCYYQSYHSSEDAMALLRFLVDENPLTATRQVDEFGMTPLHILSLSQTPNLEMLLAVMKAGADSDRIICGKDSFGSTPMDYLCSNRMPNSTQVIRRVVQTRIDWLGLDRWKLDMLQALDQALAVDWSSRSMEICRVYSKLANYERKVILSLVELCLWKVKIDEVGSKEQDADRQCCRIIDGCSIVIPLVLSFLGSIGMQLLH
eukprot:scaffold1284_cov108-Cylindrotheca_fusiformis.AAC.11